MKSSIGIIRTYWIPSSFYIRSMMRVLLYLIRVGFFSVSQPRFLWSTLLWFTSPFLLFELIVGFFPFSLLLPKVLLYFTKCLGDLKLACVWIWLRNGRYSLPQQYQLISVYAKRLTAVNHFTALLKIPSLFFYFIPVQRYGMCLILYCFRNLGIIWESSKDSF